MKPKKNVPPTFMFLSNVVVEPVGSNNKVPIREMRQDNELSVHIDRLVSRSQRSSLSWAWCKKLPFYSISMDVGEIKLGKEDEVSRQKAHGLQTMSFV
jgi:hypothetical protein